MRAETTVRPPGRRQFLAAAGSLLAGGLAQSRTAGERQALIAITLDLEMSRNFPRWNDTHWDYEKGNLNEDTKRYTVEACRRVRAHGGIAHCFVVGRVLEQENVDWLKEILSAGHRLGNHTYDHVNVLAQNPADVQFRFRRAPWLIEGKSAEEVIRENIRLTNAAMKERLGVSPLGFRTPGGFAEGLSAHPRIRRMLLDLGFTWVSSRYPAHPVPEAGKEPGADVLQGIVRAQVAAQPFRYADGLVEVPMSPISDINAFRTGRWKLEWFLRAVRSGVEWAIERGTVFDFLAHPSCLYVVDPEFRAIELICELVRKAGKRAEIADLAALAARVEK